MKKRASQKVIEALTAVYTAEIGAVGIYMDQHTKCADRGYHKLAERLKEDAVDEMKHAETLMERILFLGVDVEYLKHEVPNVTEQEIIDIIKTNIRLEELAVERLSTGIKTCWDEGDHGSRILLEKILVDEEQHLDHYETLLGNVEKYGDTFIVTHLM